jgi:hypothetical protein
VTSLLGKAFMTVLRVPVGEVSIRNCVRPGTRGCETRGKKMVDWVLCAGIEPSGVASAAQLPGPLCTPGPAEHSAQFFEERIKGTVQLSSAIGSDSAAKFANC